MCEPIFSTGKCVVLDSVFCVSKGITALLEFGVYAAALITNKSVMDWFNKRSPRFICVGRKLHPFGNERHTICCALTSILWRTQIVEGKDRSTELGKNKWE